MLSCFVFHPSYPYPNLLCPGVPRFAIHHDLLCRVARKDMNLIRVHPVSQMFERVIVPYQSVIITTCCVIATFGMGQKLVALQCTMPVCIVLHRLCSWLSLFAFTKGSNMRRICRSLTCNLMSSHCPNLVRRLLSCVVRLGTCILPRAVILGAWLWLWASFALPFPESICCLA